MLKLKKITGIFIVLVIFLLSIYDGTCFSAENNENPALGLKNSVLLYIGNSISYVDTAKKYIDSSNIFLTPFIKDGRTMVPLRFISESFGANVSWSEKTSTATIIYGNKTIKITTNSRNIIINNSAVSLDAPAELRYGRFFVPLRILAEDIMGKNVFYDRKLIAIADTPTIDTIKTDSILVDNLITMFKSSNIKHISGGYSHTAALKEDGSVWTWGEKSGSKPQQVVGIDNIRSIVAGGRRTFAVKNDGSVWTWGESEPGNFGASENKYISTPEQVTGIDNVCSLSTRFGHVLALKEDGTVWAWGENRNGELGIGNNKANYTPSQVSNLTGVKEICAGYSYSAALKEDGTVWVWGANYIGQLADASSSGSNIPIAVNGLSDVVHITIGDNSVYALKSDGSLWAWGGNEYAQMGNSNSFSLGRRQNTPMKIEGIADIKDIVSNGYQVIVLRRDGKVYTWGYIVDGVQGIELIQNFDDVTEISNGVMHLLVVKKDGSVWCWGNNQYGQLGDGTNISRTKPSKALFSIKPVSSSNLENTTTTIESITNRALTKEEDAEVQKVEEEVIAQNDKAGFDEREGSYDTITVNNEEEFLNAIKSNRIIIIKNDLTQLTKALDQNISNDNISIEDTFDGKELIIKNVNNLQIKAVGSERKNIYVTPRYADVLTFENCSGIGIENIHAGHTPDKGECVGGVFAFNSSRDIKIYNSVLFGCGTEGLILNKVERLSFLHSLIEDCTYGISTMNNCKNILLDDSEFNSCKQFNMFDISNCENVLFTRCSISKNYGVLLFYGNNNKTKIVVKDSKISENFMKYMQYNKCDPLYKNTSFDGNSFSLGEYQVD